MNQSTATFSFFWSIFASFLWIFPYTATADEYSDDHFDPPSEEDVEVYQACIPNDGFGGQASDDSITIKYYQEITFSTVGPAFGTDIVKDVETATLDELLKASRITCIAPPAVIAEAEIQVEKKKLSPWNDDDDDENRRKLRRQAVGMSSNPEDAILELDCQGSPNSASQSCMVVDAGFSVFYTGQKEDDNGALEQEFRDSLQMAVDSGRLNKANPQIIKIAITDPATYRPYRDGADGQNGDRGNVTPQDNSTLPIVVGALVGTLLIGAAAIAYQRSKRGNQGTPNPSPRNSPPPSTNKQEEG